MSSNILQPSLSADPPSGISARRAVVVHAGARDAYQLALALNEADLLEALVTDLFWTSDRWWAQMLERLLPSKAVRLLRQRGAAGLPAPKVRMTLVAGLRTLIFEKLRSMPVPVRRRAQRRADATLGRTAGQLAKRHGAALVSYSYYGFDAFRQYPHPAMLFQMHPHPATMRRILSEELAAHPDCAASLQQEWELALEPEDFDHLVQETRMAARFLVASTFTRDSLIEHGAAADAITVIPYGVDLVRFHPPAQVRSTSGKLKLLFVGRINQRKGVKYLLEALRLLKTKEVELTICGRVLDDLALFNPFAGQVRIRPSVSAEELVQAYQAADLFVFPSVAEGFAQVLLESLACGLPILSTTHTAAPDLIEDGEQGFIVAPRRPDLLAEKIAWAADHRPELARMGVAARQCAETFTWERYRRKTAEAVRTFIETDESSRAAGD